MKTTNILDKSFGPVGSFAGIIVFIAGLVLTCFHFSGIVLVLAGAFTGFSSSGTIIDYDKKRIKFSNNIFGVLRIGKWLPVEPSMKLGIRESTQAFRAYSQGNRPLDVPRHDYRIFLCDSGNKEIMTIQKCGTVEEARAACAAMAGKLGLGQV